MFLISRSFSRTEALFLIMSIIWNMVFLSSIWLLYLLDKGISLFGAAFLDVGYSLTILFLEVPTGYIADRFGRKKSVLAGIIIESIAVIGFGLANTISEFLASYIAWGIGSTFISGALAAWLFDEIKFENKGDQKKAKKRFHHVYSIYIALGWVSSSIAETLGGILASIRYEIPIFLTSVIWVIAAFIGLFIPEHRGTQNRVEEKTEDEKTSAPSLEPKNPTLRIALREFRRPEILSITFLMLGLSSVGISIAFYFPVYLSRLNVPLSLIGLYFALGTISTATGNLLSTKYFGKAEDRTLVLLICLELLTIISLMIGRIVWVAVLSWVVFSHLRGAIMPYVSSELNGFLNSLTRATAISLTSIAHMISLVIFELSAAKIIEIYGFFEFYLSLALITALIILPLSTLFAFRYSEMKLESQKSEHAVTIPEDVDF